MPNYSKKIVYLSEAQKVELFTNHTLTVDGSTITFNENDIYVTPQQSPYIKPVNGIPASDLATGVVNVNDVRVNGTSVLSNGIANIPLATASEYGVVRSAGSQGTSISSGILGIYPATETNIKEGTHNYRPIVPLHQEKSVFYGLAKAAGTDMAQSSNAVGTYTDTAKQAIQKMFGFDNILGNYESSSTASKAYTIGETFIFNGKRYRVTADIAQNYVITPGTNCELDPIDGRYVRNTDYATSSKAGVVQVDAGYGIYMRDSPNQHIIRIYPASANTIKQGGHSYQPLVPNRQHESVFYGLSKAAGVDLANETVTVGTYPAASKTAIRGLIGAISKDDIAGSSGENRGVAYFNGSYGVGINSETGGVYLSKSGDDLIKAGANEYKPIVPFNEHKAVFFGLAKAAGQDLANEVITFGTYPDVAKTAIRNMIGATSNKVIAVQDEQPTDVDTKIWLPETENTGIQVPTYEEFQALDTAVVKKTDIATSSTAGIVKVNSGFGIYLYEDQLRIYRPTDAQIKAGNNNTCPITPSQQDISVFYGLAKAAGDTTQAASDNAVGTYTDGAKGAIQTMLGVPGDIQVNGTSVVSNGVANITKAIDNSSNLGVVGTETSFGIRVNDSGKLYTYTAGDNELRLGTQGYKPIVPANQHKSIFFGLAKAANADMASLSDLTIGQYPQAQKTAIQSMLGIEANIPLIEEVSGTTPTIVGMPNVRYICGEVTLLTITPPATGSIVVRFSTGSSTTLTVPNTVKWPAWFDATSLNADTTYEIIITDGVYGGVMSWA